MLEKSMQKRLIFFENAKFVSGKPNGYFPFKKKGFFCMSLFLTAFFAFQCRMMNVYPPVELRYIEGLYRKIAFIIK